jgi:hypothetical protein
MTILQGDIQLRASQVMLDVDEGGGAPTATQIQDGQSNGVFADVSEVDRAGGSLRPARCSPRCSRPTPTATWAPT